MVCIKLRYEENIFFLFLTFQVTLLLPTFVLADYCGYENMMGGSGWGMMGGQNFFSMALVGLIYLILIAVIFSVIFWAIYVAFKGTIKK